MLNEGTVTADVFIVFLKRLLDGARQSVFLIVDGHPTHRSIKVKKFVEEQNGRLELFFLPPYSPQLNPDEQFWAHVKRQVSKRLIQSKEEMKNYQSWSNHSSSNPSASMLSCDITFGKISNIKVSETLI